MSKDQKTDPAESVENAETKAATSVAGADEDGKANPKPVWDTATQGDPPAGREDQYEVVDTFEADTRDSADDPSPSRAARQR